MNLHFSKYANVEHTEVKTQDDLVDEDTGKLLWIGVLVVSSFGDAKKILEQDHVMEGQKLELDVMEESGEGEDAYD